METHFRVWARTINVHKGKYSLKKFGQCAMTVKPQLNYNMNKQYTIEIFKQKQITTIMKIIHLLFTTSYTWQ